MTFHKRLLILSALLAPLCVSCRRQPQEIQPDGQAEEKTAAKPDYAGSLSCKRCHEKEYVKWMNSHHALAEVPFDPKKHGPAFEPGQTVRHGKRESVVGKKDGKYAVITEGADGKITPFTPLRIIGKSPLWQAVVPGERGRYQVMALSYDPHKHEWFDVYGDEDRRPHEWGFWANRGMTWNSMCGSCHTTDYHK
ncbi:MAG: multiheme c-type cytochrome, partial [Planctomycetota bacterium]|nr:multiheme c-type cytochrome [Planctomycetota bacterium]